MRTPAPHTLIEADYWRDPVQVLTGIAWLLAGISIGILIGVAA